MLIKILNLILLLIIPFLMTGLIRKTKAFWGARKGASIFQPFYDFIKLMKKDSIFSTSTTSLFKIAPIILTEHLPECLDKPFLRNYRNQLKPLYI